jgi:hypothetical protein
MPSSAPGTAGTIGRPPVASTMLRGAQSRAADLHALRADAVRAAAYQLDLALLEIFRVDLVQRRYRPRAWLRSAASRGAKRQIEPVAGRIRAPCASCAAFHMIFFGTQPTLTQVPPSRCPIRSARAGSVFGGSLGAGQSAAAAADHRQIVVKFIGGPGCLIFPCHVTPAVSR